MGAVGVENGFLGYPVTDPSADPSSAKSYTQSFQNGTVAVTRDASGRAVATATR